MEYTRCRDLAAEPGQPLSEVHRPMGEPAMEPILLGKMLGEYLVNVGDPESKDPKRCGKWGKPFGK